MTVPALLPQDHPDKVTGELVAAIAGVMRDVSHIVPTGRNDYDNYDYASDVDMFVALTPAMAAHELALLPVAIDKVYVQHDGRDNKLVRCDVDITFMLLHSSGGFVYVHALGQGTDRLDKAASKAQTQALKSVLKALFLTPVLNKPVDQERVEREEREDRAKVMQRLARAGVRVSEVNRWAEATGRTPLHGQADDALEASVEWLVTKEGKRVVEDWVKANGGRDPMSSAHIDSREERS